MKKNGSKTTKKSAAAAAAPAEQPENTQQVAAVETPETKPEAGADVEGPAGAPSDGEGCEGVTVVVIETNPKAAIHAKIVARSVKQNLNGVDALVVILSLEQGMTVPEVLGRFVNECAGSQDRLILMTDGMVILNPVTLGDIAVVKAKKVGEALNYNTGLPVLMHLSALKALLTEAKEAGLDHIDVVDVYFRGTLPEYFKPVILGEWHSDLWLLPVISKNPSIGAIEKYAQWKKFMHVGPDSWSGGLMKFLEKRFPE